MTEFVHRFIPSRTGRNDTTLVLLHGTGGNEEDLLPLGQFFAPDAALLGIRGKVLEGGMPRFFRRLAEGVFDEEDLIFRSRELSQFLDEATSTYELNRDRLTAVGYSNGANIAASILLLEPQVFSSAVLLRAMVPLEPQQHPDLTGKKVLMQCGSQDPLIPPQNSERLAELLKASGADVTLRFANSGHGLTNPELAEAQAWVGKLV